MDSIKKIWPFLVGLALSISLLWPIFVAPTFTRHDDVEVIRLYEMDRCFKDHQIPCRWVPDLGGMYGYPLFNYYAPLPYYFGELIYFITHSLIISSKVMFIVSFLGAYIFMYLLARKFWGSLGGSLSAIFYSFAPYHALDFYVRGAMGEMWGLMFFPAVFWAAAKLNEELKISNLLLLAIFLAALFTSHNISAMVFLPFYLIWNLVFFCKSRSKKFLVYGVGALILGTLLSAFYLFPANFEKELVHVETTVIGYFSYTEHFKGLRRLLLDRAWAYGPSVREVPGGERDLLSYQIGWVHLLGLVLALVSVKTLWNKNRPLSWVIIFCSASVVFLVFMIHPRSVFVWGLIEPLKYLQFPWRLLQPLIFFISLAAGSIFVWVRKKKQIWLVLVFLVVVFNFSYFKPEKFIQTSDEKLLTGSEWERQIMRSIFDFLPKSAKEPPAQLAKERYEVLTGNSKVYDFKEGTNWLNFKTETQTHTIIRLSQYYFPDWKILVDGKEVKFDYKNNSLGLMTILLGTGNHFVEARLYDTPIRSISNTITTMAISLTLIIFILHFAKVRKWVGYYRKRIN